MDPRSNVLGHSDVLCANHFATVRVTRLSRLRCREANTLGVRSAYPLASACCGCPARTKDLRNRLTSDYKLSWLFLKCQRFCRTWCSTIESGGSSAFGNEIAEKRWCLAFRRSRVKRTPPARRRTGLNRVNCTNANTYRVGTSPLLTPV